MSRDDLEARLLARKDLVMENLKKSVVAVMSPSFWKTYRMLIMGAVLFFSVLLNYAFYQSFRREEEQHNDFAQMWTQDEQIIKQLHDTADRFQRDLAAMSFDGEVGYDEVDTFQLSTPAWVDVYATCKQNPASLYFAPESFDFNNRPFQIQNPEPMRNDSGTMFAPNQTCWIGGNGVIRLLSIENGKRYLMWVDYQKLGSSEPDACPDSAYHLVLAENEIVKNAIFRGCMQRTKFVQLGLVH